MVVFLNGLFHNRAAPPLIRFKDPIRIFNRHFIAAPPNEAEFARGEPEQLCNRKNTAPDNDSREIPVNTEQLVPGVDNGLSKLVGIWTAEVDVQDADTLVEIDAAKIKIIESQRKSLDNALGTHSLSPIYEVTFKSMGEMCPELAWVEYVM